jgi:ribosomal protein L24E
MSYLIQYDSIENEDLQTVVNILSMLDGIALSQLQLSDLILCQGEVIYPGNGVYLFRRAKEVLYVGKCSRMSFIERVPNHFDVRKQAMQNHLLKNICRKMWEIPDTDEHLMEAAKYSFQNLNLILINFRQHKEKIGEVERSLQKGCAALFNRSAKTHPIVAILLTVMAFQ